MRLAVSGSHLVGKTTLVGALAEALPGHQTVPEPYRSLEEDGHEFLDMPSLEDFELQLKRWFRCVHESGTSAIFDRCALDILGYLVTHRDADAFRLEDWISHIQESVRLLDAVVFVPIEEPDRIAVRASDTRLRAQVDAALRDIVVDDAYGLGFEVIVAEGSVPERVRRVLDMAASSSALGI